jgi:transposase-like protein
MLPMSKIQLCPKCGQQSILLKYGKTSNNTQRYKCKVCSKTFVLDQSPLKHMSNTDYMIKKVIGYMIDDVTLSVIARNLNLNIKTCHYYRHLIFHSLSDYQDEVILNGKILIDETFVSIREKQYKIIKSDGKNYRGLSFNQLCIITLVNLEGIVTAKVSSRAMALPIHYFNLFSINVKDPELFIHDGNPKQYQFMNSFECKKVNARKDPDEIYNTDYVDSFHSNIKRYFFKHAGFKLKYIQHYLNFFVYRYNYLSKHKPKNISQQLDVKNLMINDLFNRVKKTSKIITYSNYLKDRGITDILESR